MMDKLLVFSDALDADTIELCSRRITPTSSMVGCAAAAKKSPAISPKAPESPPTAKKLSCTPTDSTPSTEANTRVRVQPRQARTPNSRRRPRTAAAAAGQAPSR